MIKLKHISKTFKKNKTDFFALNDVNLYVPQGQIFGVIGHSGAGKSTLIRIVNLLEKPTSGEIIVNGQNLQQLSKQNLALARKKIGMIFQQFNLLSSRTVFDNIALPLELSKTNKEIITHRVNELLELVELTDKKNTYPAELSGGQKQRVAIARALANNPNVLLCDEATSALDPQNTQSILNLLKEINLKMNLTILLITHEMNVVKQICNQVAIINEGKLVETAPVNELFSDPKTQIARDFIRSSLNLNIPDDYKKKLSQTPKIGSPYPLVKLEFTGKSVDAPLLSEITKQFNVNNNIISAQMDYISGTKFGFLLTEIQGNPENITNAIEFLKQNYVKVEVLGYV